MDFHNSRFRVDELLEGVLQARSPIATAIIVARLTRGLLLISSKGVFQSSDGRPLPIMTMIGDKNVDQDSRINVSRALETPGP